MDLDAPRQPCYTRGCFGILYFAYAAAFFYFAIYNPDPGHCWAKDGIDTPMPGDELVGGYKLMNREFTNWFMWNFILYTIHAFLSCLVSSFPIVDELFNLG